MGNRLYVCPILNTMGPVTDPRHDDLLSTWDAVDAATSRYFTDQFRETIVDARGRGVIVSWFPVSWSGFDSNPVHRDFGWFTIYDHLEARWGGEIRRRGDGVYWMYNHPDKSGVGNAWGLDWLHNCHYLNILNRMVLHRGFFPGVLEIPTADRHSSRFVENYFPFELSNRNSPFINWDNIEADGRRTRDVLQWADAPDDWIPYRPSAENHQVPGEMKHFIFRLLDIKTRIMTFPEAEIIKAFEACRDGSDVIVAGYEHDFRDRCDAVRELFLEPIRRVAARYPDVEVHNASFQDAAIHCTRPGGNPAAPRFSADWRKDFLLIGSDVPLFGESPYAAVEDGATGHVMHLHPLPIGVRTWRIPRDLLPAEGVLAVAGFSLEGLQSVCRFRLTANGMSKF